MPLPHGRLVQSNFLLFLHPNTLYFSQLSDYIEGRATRGISFVIASVGTQAHRDVFPPLPYSPFRSLFLEASTARRYTLGPTILHFHEFFQGIKDHGACSYG